MTAYYQQYQLPEDAVPDGAPDVREWNGAGERRAQFPGPMGASPGQPITIRRPTLQQAIGFGALVGMLFAAGNWAGRQLVSPGKFDAVVERLAAAEHHMARIDTMLRTNRDTAVAERSALADTLRLVREDIAGVTRYLCYQMDERDRAISAMNCRGVPYKNVKSVR